MKMPPRCRQLPRLFERNLEIREERERDAELRPMNHSRHAIFWHSKEALSD